jgi:Zn finger protein HypA/HybF involved in hydrogenase expression
MTKGFLNASGKKKKSAIKNNIEKLSCKICSKPMLKVSSHTKYKCETCQRIEFIVDKLHSHYHDDGHTGLSLLESEVR